VRCQPLRHCWDERTLRPVYADLESIRARIATLEAELAPLNSRRPPKTRLPNELRMLHEYLELFVASGSLSTARAIAQGIGQRAQRARSQIFLSRVLQADLDTCQGDYVSATLSFIELMNMVGETSRSVQAVAHLRAGRCEFAQEMWAEAAVSFEAAAEAARGARLPVASAAEIRFALRCAQAHLQDAVA
jgi:hypothetical protein